MGSSPFLNKVNGHRDRRLPSPSQPKLNLWGISSPHRTGGRSFFLPLPFLTLFTIGGTLLFILPFPPFPLHILHSFLPTHSPWVSSHSPFAFRCKIKSACINNTCLPGASAFPLPDLGFGAFLCTQL